MKKKMFLVSGILTSIVFIVMLIEMVTGERSFSQIKLKEIVYLAGWLLLSISLLYQYSNE